MILLILILAIAGYILDISCVFLKSHEPLVGIIYPMVISIILWSKDLYFLSILSATLLITLELLAIRRYVKKHPNTPRNPLTQPN